MLGVVYLRALFNIKLPSSFKRKQPVFAYSHHHWFPDLQWKCLPPEHFTCLHCSTSNHIAFKSLNIHISFSLPCILVSLTDVSSTMTHFNWSDTITGCEPGDEFENAECANWELQCHCHFWSRPCRTDYTDSQCDLHPPQCINVVSVLPVCWSSDCQNAQLPALERAVAADDALDGDTATQSILHTGSSSCGSSAEPRFPEPAMTVHGCSRMDHGRRLLVHHRHHDPVICQDQTMQKSSGFFFHFQSQFSL